MIRPFSIPRCLPLPFSECQSLFWYTFIFNSAYIPVWINRLMDNLPKIVCSVLSRSLFRHATLFAKEKANLPRRKETRKVRKVFCSLFVKIACNELVVANTSFLLPWNDVRIIKQVRIRWTKIKPLSPGSLKKL